MVGTIGMGFYGIGAGEYRACASGRCRWIYPESKGEVFEKGFCISITIEQYILSLFSS